MRSVIHFRHIVLFFTAFCFLTAAADIQPVRWSASLSPIEIDRAVLTVTGEIEDGWHIYGFEMPDFHEDVGVPDPTVMELVLPEGITADGEMDLSGNATVHFDSFMNLNLPWLTGTVTMSQKLIIKDGVNGEILGSVRYMACDSAKVLPPSKYTFDLPVCLPRIPDETRHNDVLQKSSVNEETVVHYEEAEPSETAEYSSFSAGIAKYLRLLAFVLLVLCISAAMQTRRFGGKLAMVRFAGGALALAYLLTLLPEIF